MTIDQMRVELTKKYPGAKWARRVQNMSETQVYATYMRLTKDKK